MLGSEIWACFVAVEPDGHGKRPRISYGHPAQVLVGYRRFNVGTILGQGETGRHPSKEISGFLERSHWIRGAIVRINDLSNAPAS